jgi:hypothetical protein
MPDGIDVSPEEREQIVDIRFGQLFDKHWDRKFGESFDKRVTEMQATRRRQGPPQQPQPQQQPDPEPDERHHMPSKRRSLFEICLSDTLGF